MAKASILVIDDEKDLLEGWSASTFSELHQILTTTDARKGRLASTTRRI